MKDKEKYLMVVGIPRNPKTHLPFEQYGCTYEHFLREKKRSSKTHKVYYKYSKYKDPF